MTYEMMQWLSTEGIKETGNVLTFKKGTPTYQLKASSANMIGGHYTAKDYEKTGKTLTQDVTINETKEMKEFGFAVLTTGDVVLLNESEGYINPWIKRGIIAAIAIAIIGFIWYKCKH